MWRCPKCRSKVDDDFEVCWSCGTTPDGVEDPEFLTADEAEVIGDPPDNPAALGDNPLDDFAGTPWPDLVECFMAGDTMEAKFVADQLMLAGIPAVADHRDGNVTLGGYKHQLWGYGPKVRVRAEDLAKARAWLETYDQYKKSKAPKK